MSEVLLLFDGSVSTGHAVANSAEAQKLRFWWAVIGGDAPFNVYKAPNGDIAMKALLGVDVVHKLSPILFYDPEDDDYGDMVYWTPSNSWRKVPSNWEDNYPIEKIRLLDEEMLQYM
jgi:hypothetical protein